MLDKFKKYKKWIDRTVIWLFAFITLDMIWRTLEIATKVNKPFLFTFFNHKKIDYFSEYFLIVILLFITYWIFIGFKSKKEE